MNAFEVVILPIMLIGFAAAFFIQFRLHKHVSREKILQIQDVRALWKNSIPPKEVLNDEGLRLYRYFQIGIGVFVVGCFLMVAGGFAGGLSTLFK
ncbi:hypothetical protein SAMN04487965_2092 [Microbulbifer donghaiensis]|uniref:Uncharacterized protein n=1 Tax=Microbulbifer donghaiensis TaxID=494016 RepID=A0A1M5C7R4_9GAMM|nr:hypothetical protein [Microbulbifer donghaiensis]SHF50765.1 hypothetical protein SAMN04487965_2092 [Microbulbifer donghaiensis]